MNEAFDFTGMSDVDYTNTFADIDQAEEDKAVFTAGLRKAILVRAKTPEKKGWIWGEDPALDPLFAAAVSGSAADGWTVSFADVSGVSLRPAFGPSFADEPNPAAVALYLDAAPAAWSKSARWSLVGGAPRYELFILPKRSDGENPQLAGSPERVDGDVYAGIRGNLAAITGLPQSAVCASLAGAPRRVGGCFECVMDPGADFGPGFMNGAPERVGGKFAVTVPDAPRMPRPVKSFLWDAKGNIVPAFTDGKKRMYDNVCIDVPHPGANVADRRKSARSCLYIVAGPHALPRRIYDVMFPGMYADSGRVDVYGDPDACVRWLMVMNGLK